jgi:4-hydroxy-2-oxoglutarate aldolase
MDGYNASTLSQSNEDQSQVRSAALSAKDLCGLFLPITTPFHMDESVDLEGLRANIRKWNRAGISGYVVMGSTGERVHLDEAEYVQVIEAARRDVPAHLAFIAGAGQQSTRGTVAEIRRAAAAGVNAVLVITPNFYRAAITPDVLVKHYNEIADASPVPVILYSMPDLTGVKIEPQTTATLSTHANIIGIKDSSADLENLRETVKLVRGPKRDAGETSTVNEFAIMTGNGTVLLEALTAGVDGAILAVGCVAPALCLEIIQAMQNEDRGRAQQLQANLTPLARAVTRTYGIGGLKAALDIIGYTGGAVRAPLQAATTEARNEIQNYLRAAETAMQEVSMKQVM